MIAMSAAIQSQRKNSQNGQGKVHKTCVPLESEEDTMNWKKVVPQIIGLTLIVLLLFGFSKWYSPAFELTESTTRILFIGNSLTFYNNFPEMVAELAHSGGYNVEIDVSAYGGWTLSDHAASTVTRGKIEQEDWNYVVLQEQSVIPSIVDERTQQMYPAVRFLHSKIGEKGAFVILFMTWGYRNGFPDSGFSNFDEMQAQLHTGYTEIATELGVLVAPVGTAWQNAVTQNPELNLWQMDGVHPTEGGSYLSACVFYALIFQQSPEGLTYRAGLSEEMAYFLQSIAAETVLDQEQKIF